MVMPLSANRPCLELLQTSAMVGVPFSKPSPRYQWVTRTGSSLWRRVKSFFSFLSKPCIVFSGRQTPICFVFVFFLFAVAVFLFALVGSNHPRSPHAQIVRVLGMALQFYDAFCGRDAQIIRALGNRQGTCFHFAGLPLRYLSLKPKL